MAVSPELAAAMQGQGAGQQAGQTPGGPEQSPVSAPMSTPQPNVGEQQQAMSQVQMAIKILEGALPALGATSKEGQVVLEALKKLGHEFSHGKEKQQGLIPSEIMNMVGSMPQGMQQQMGGQPPQSGGQPPQM